MKGDQPLTIAALRVGMEAEFAALLRIYTSSIPAPERKGESALRAMLANPACTFLLARCGDEVLGFAIVVRIAPGAALLEYIAVDGNHRGAGIGTQLFRESAAPRAWGPRLLLMEVEIPQPGAPDYALQESRIDFYRRQGCRTIDDLVYRMPSVTSAEPPPMRLCVFADALPSAVAKSQVRGWLEAIYAEVYQCSRQDPVISEMLAGLPEELPLI